MRAYILLSILGLCCLLPNAECAQLSAADSIATPGATLVIPVALVSEASTISGVQFDLAWDDSALGLVLMLGSGASAAGKNLYAAALNKQTARYLIIGLNQRVLPDDAVVRIFAFVRPTTSPGVYPLRFSNVVATDPAGHSVSISARAINIDVQRNGSIGQSLLSAGVLNAASLIAGPVAPGEVISLLGPGSAIVSPPVTADQLSLRFDGMPAPLLYVGENQINAVVPFGVESSTAVTLEIRVQDREVAKAVLPVVSVQPGLFTQNSSGTGPGSILNQDFTLNSITNPAERGSIIMLFGTGFGQTDPTGTDGQITAEPMHLKVPVTATIGDQSAEVLYAGSAPGLIEGMAQVNVRVPDDIAASLTVPVVLRLGTVQTQTGVTLAIR